MGTKNKKVQYLALAAAAVFLIVSFYLLYTVVMPSPQEGNKSVTIVVEHKDGSRRTEDYQTDLEYLGELLLEKDIVRGEQGPYGLYITWADGEEADESAQEWWCITKDGEMHMNSADITVLEDGDQFELTLKVGYDE